MEHHKIKGKWINVERLDLKVHVTEMQNCLMAGKLKVTFMTFIFQCPLRIRTYADDLGLWTWTVKKASLLLHLASARRLLLMGFESPAGGS